MHRAGARRIVLGFSGMPCVTREAWGDLAATAFVEANVLFKVMDDEARQDLLQLAHVEDFEAGELIAADGEDERLYLVRDGTAAVLLSRDGVAVEVGELGATPSSARGGCWAGPAPAPWWPGRPSRS